MEKINVSLVKDENKVIVEISAKDDWGKLLLSIMAAAIKVSDEHNAMLEEIEEYWDENADVRNKFENFDAYMKHCENEAYAEEFEYLQGYMSTHDSNYAEQLESWEPREFARLEEKYARVNPKIITNND